ncbi:hypothetical protein [Frankia sp. QA3]|uniref:hypothetical protein n=1 Tax=Frankia sp. QA3 TaxID=710111 RepID=UPI0002E9EF94|nr:hypothetical protein [Frankia sp. QA3]
MATSAGFSRWAANGVLTPAALHVAPHRSVAADDQPDAGSGEPGGSAPAAPGSAQA